MTPEFTLDPPLAAGSVTVSDLSLCQLRLMNDARFPWLLLVPRRDGLRELFDLPAFDQAQVLIDLNRAAAALQAVATPDKLNIGALGNIVPQLHIHLIARFVGDPAWPGPVWGQGSAVAYTEEALQAQLAALRAALEALDA
ncbi:HIT domain-containing protein [Aquimonas sp.]|jgi:diadenosine tetraphosphate (Ap4A) HIT family hydrolase|uniref:HIT domain-containing protein n=1 Tax=Aquimonas sp. TaxID=1872588 RepID=UPI0037BFD39D